MQIRYLIFALAVVCFAGCARDDSIQGHGDVGQFILQQAILRGGNPITTNTLPAITSQWRYSQDTNGVVIVMARDQYPAVETFLRKAFGDPKFGPFGTDDGGKLGGYRLSAKGGAIQFSCDNKDTHVIVIRPMETSEVMEEVVKAMKGKPK